MPDVTTLGNSAIPSHDIATGTMPHRDAATHH